MRRVSLLLGLLVVPPVAPPSAWGDEPATPTPPHQGRPWTPPSTTLPRFLAAATAALCDQGLADPRGCDYRRVKLRVGDAWGRVAEVETGGWALPAPDGGPPRHAIAWSGLVYPLVADLGPADLAGDVRAIVAPPDPRRDFLAVAPIDEASSVAAGTFDPVKACLLLRSGRGDLAEAAWAQAHGSPREDRPGPRAKLDLTTYGVS